MTLLAIDPGKHTCACARFEFGALTSVFERRSFDHLGVWFVERVICEVPQLDGRPPVDILPVAGAGYHLAGVCRVPARFVTPREWKGSMPKPVHHRKVWQALSLTERTALPDYTENEINKALMRGAKDGWRKPGGTYYRGERGKVHNALDAVALGLFELGRLVVV